VRLKAARFHKEAIKFYHGGAYFFLAREGDGSSFLSLYAINS